MMDGGSPRRSLLDPLKNHSLQDGLHSPVLGSEGGRRGTLGETAPLLPPANRFEVESPDVYLENLRARSRLRRSSFPAAPRRTRSTTAVFGIAVLVCLLTLLIILTAAVKHTHRENKAAAELLAAQLYAPPPRTASKSRRAQMPPASAASDEAQAKEEEADIVDVLTGQKQSQPQNATAIAAPRTPLVPVKSPPPAVLVPAPAPAPAPAAGPEAIPVLGEAKASLAAASQTEGPALQSLIATTPMALAPLVAVASSEIAAGVPMAAPVPTRASPPPPQTLREGLGDLFNSAVAEAAVGAAKIAPPAVQSIAAVPSSPPPPAFLSTSAAALAASTATSSAPASTAPASAAPKIGVSGPLANAYIALPDGIPPAPDGLPLQQWADNWWFEIHGAPAPEGMPPAPPNLETPQWASQWVFQQQQTARSAATGSGGFAHAPAPGSGPDAGTLVKTSLEGYDSMAVCNDGSPGAFYYTAGSDPTTWLIYLEGGLWCWSAATCQERQADGPNQVSSTGWPDSMSQNGIFDTDATLNPFATANKVYLGYCSSDGWTGDSPAEATEAKYGFSFGFHGRRILKATLEALQQDFGLGATSGTKILMGGCSAGARGAMYNVDSVAAGVPEGVTVQALLDSSLWINVEPYQSSITSLADQCQMGLPLFNATGVLNPDCVAAQQQGQEYLCLMGEYLVPYLLTPYFLYESQFDAFQLPYNMGLMPTVQNVSEMDYANTWQSDLIRVIQDLPAPNQPDSGIFSLSCLRHCLTMGSAFWGAMVGTTSFASASGAWFYHGENKGAQFMAKCYTYQRCMFC